MNFLENIELSISGLLLNKMRSLLTMLGIIIGIGSVIAIFTIGNSFQGYMSSELQTLGANNITVAVRDKDSESTSQRGNPFSISGGLTELNASDEIQQYMVDELINEYNESILAVNITESVGSGKSINGEYYANLSLLGVNEGYLQTNDITLVEGRFFSNEDHINERKLALVSSNYVSNLNIEGNVVGKSFDVLVNNRITSFTIVGVYEYVESSLGSSTVSEKEVSSNFYIPLSTANTMTGNNSYQSITIVAESEVNSTMFAKTVNTFMNNYYSNNQKYEINASSLESLANTMSSLLNTLELAISAIAALALLVGGIGVMNIMLVSITERTKEIGTRKALGATNLSIQIQFITESAIITLIGGILGVIFGLLLGFLGSTLLGYPGSADIMDILVAVGTSILIGVFFGYYPANKAAKLDPIEALRYE